MTTPTKNYKTPPVMFGGSGYLERVTQRGTLAEVIKRVTRKIEDTNLDFDFIACRGVSGIIVAPAVAIAVDRPFAVVRKPNERSHAGSIKVEGWTGGGRFIIVDDFVDTGKTIFEIWDTLVKDVAKYKRQNRRYPTAHTPVRPVPVGIFTYGFDLRDEVELFTRLRSGDKRLQHTVKVYGSY